MPSLGTTFGRGAATMALWDLANSDCIIEMGSNLAENHPVGFRFVVEAQRRGATVIHIDPRYTRTSALADIYAPIRSGSDIAFLGGMIRHILENDLWFRDFALAYTNISHIIEEGYGDPEQNEGLFSGYDPVAGTYSQDTWQYAGKTVPSPVAEHRVQSQENSSDEGAAFESMTKSPPPQDPTLQHPNCVYQIMRRHYARYTPEMVERVTSCPKDLFVRITEIFAHNSGREKTGAFTYAVGWTHHSTGVQIIRAASIIQGLLGNIGRPGGGIMALRGHVSIQGSTDIPTLYNMLPTYLPQPNVFHDHATVDRYLATETPPTGWWSNMPKYVISLLKAWYGEAATRENGWGYQFLPKLTGDASQEPMTMAMSDRVVKGQFILGQNPAVGAVNSELVERGFANLEWMVVRDFAMTETANFWQQGHRVRKGEVRPEEIGTEMFFLPAAMPGEKDGSVTNTSRLVQWHDVVCEPPGDSRSDLWFIVHLGRRLKELYRDSIEPKDRAIQALTWDYALRGEKQEPDAEAVLREINGRTVADGKQVADYRELKDDGSTACGGWMYCGIFPETGKNLSRSRRPDGPGESGAHLGWAWTWPLNRRTLYNRASADPAGKPWSERKKMIWWDEAQAKWTGNDVPDFLADKRPDYRPDWSKRPHGMDALGGDDPFIMEADGKCALFVPSGLKDGPLPTHYEPIESPVRNPLYPKQQRNPTAKLWGRPGNELHDAADPRFPYVFTTFRLTEMHCGGIATRVMPHTAELQPEAFVEISPELAASLRIRHLGWTVISTLRGEVEVRAMVTERLKPFRIDGREVHQIGMPWVYGWQGYARGDVANVLLAITGDANTSIHSTKAITCNIRPGRKARPDVLGQSEART
ncbi:molybdopterin-dependent oxidoreductase [Methylobacterium sp. E-046]|nr:molybdopterin-dependent oxidoreductase [Methylobacterium sp. E-046]